VTKINSECTIFSAENLKIIEEHYKAKYVYQTHLMGKSCWTNIVGAVFWQDNPPNDYDNWFALYYSDDSKLMVTSATDTAKHNVTALNVGEDEWIYSHNLHHFCEKNGLAIDGGREYTRLIGNKPFVTAEFKPTPDGLVNVGELER